MLMKKKNYRYFTCIWTRPSKKIQALQLETAWAQDNRNTKKGQNYAFAGEQQEGIKANTTNISDLEVNPLSTEKMNKLKTQHCSVFSQQGQMLCFSLGCSHRNQQLGHYYGGFFFVLPARNPCL